MARSRNLKPGFFKNETLAECSPLARLLFAGLWCLADRSGRLEDRPKRIRAELLPYDDGSVDDMLNELHQAGFILRYQVGEQRLIQVLNFGKHQTPHHKEPASTIPAPDSPKSNPGQAPDSPKSSRADSLNLIPDSLNLEKSSCPQPAADDQQQAGKKIDSCPHQQIIDAYHELLPTGRMVKDWSDARRTKLKARWREDAKRQSLDWWRKFFGYINASDFLTGRTSTPGRRPFEIDLEWIVTPANFVKIIEGKFENKEVV